MATLSQSTATTRTVLKWAGIAFVVFLVIRLILFPLGKLAINTLFPKKPPPPTVAFGKLPKIPFPQTKKSSSLRFSIQTTSGTLPQTPDRLGVYPIAEKQASFSSPDRAKQKVARLGFTGEGKLVSPIAYQWVDSGENRQITFNTVTEAFRLTTKLASDSSQIEPPPQQALAITAAKTFLSTLSLLPADLDDTKTITTLLKIKSGQLTKATSLSDSDYMQVDFYRKSISDLPIVNPNPTQSLLSILVKSDSNTDRQVVEAHYAYKVIDSDAPSTYPIKTAQEAFEELKQNQGYIASSIENQATVAIRKVYLAYYEGEDGLAFLLPVFVFEGDDEFQAFVEAIQTVWQE